MFYSVVTTRATCDVVSHDNVLPFYISTVRSMCAAPVSLFSVVR
jgi:hypothetical protein